MSTTDNDTSDIKKAAEHANADKIENNLADKKQVDIPEDLTEAQKTPFIDEAVRTDK
jgi:hypothetical protein